MWAFLSGLFIITKGKDIILSLLIGILVGLMINLSWSFDAGRKVGRIEERMRKVAKKNAPQDDPFPGVSIDDEELVEPLDPTGSKFIQGVIEELK